jgi:hypothetical protein
MLLQKSDRPISELHKSEQIETCRPPAVGLLACKRHSEVGEVAALIRQTAIQPKRSTLRFFPVGMALLK